MTQSERIKAIRKKLGLTLEKFGDRLGVTKTTISRIERGERNLTEQMTKSICREFNVNPNWLHDGTGEMFIQTDRKDDISKMVNDLMNEEDNEFKTRFINMLANLNVNEWKILEEKVLYLFGKENSDTTNQEEQNNVNKEENDIDSMVADYRKELELEEKAKEKLSASQKDVS